MTRGAALVAAMAAVAWAGGSRAQAVHRGVSAEGRVTETVQLLDAWEDGGAGGPHADATLDVLTRIEDVNEPARRTTTHLLLFGAWGGFAYAFDEERVVPGSPDTTSLLTTMRAVDLDGDGSKELVLLERSLTTRIAMDEQGLPDDEPGPFFQDAAARIRYLARENGSLVEHDLEAEASAPAVRELLDRELPFPQAAWLQLAAADVDFGKQRYEQARYRYGVVREWAEARLLPRDIDRLSPLLPLPGASPDAPEVLWLAATRRIGALPRWYQKR